MKKILILLVLIFVASGTLSVRTNASSIYELSTTSSLIENVSIKTMDGYFASSSGLEYDEGAILITLTSQAEYELFKGMSVDDKKRVMNMLAQSNWGDYLGASVCYILVIYNDNVYAVGKTTYNADDSSISLQNFEQGSLNLTPWKKEPTNADNSKVKSISIKDTGVIIKYNTMLPAAQVFKNLGGSIQLNNKTKDITFKYSDTTINSKLNSKYIKINNAKSSYAVAPQIIDGKLMVPLQLLKDLFNVTVTVNKGEYGYDSTYIKSVTLLSDTAKLTVPVNDLYESYKSYYGKTAWIHNPQVVVKNLSGKSVDEQVKNLAQVMITKVERKIDDGNVLNVYFVHKGKTYKVNIEQSDFKFVFYTVSPYKQYKYSQHDWKQIEDMTISVGMTSDMVYLSWGIYDRHSKDIFSWGTSDMWVYERSIGGNKYLFFVNDVLQSISTY
ncbi:copper amine oxidase N-terminal domain-containing protein [Paenibacillus sp. J22TS3]|uniref:copper amine oxidase N-terminal domain-containing protein n=1 Tax=Paenibacillus sp. J22TS3 TaxID=2807192 RepID=UPI001BD1372C|nr:copper amine oxidase N-terminal domain-containing protein [Paenibacillus sp. J22TS3]